MARKTQEQCINGFIKVHGDEYDYSQVIYEGNDIPVNIICKIHGVFRQTPHHHLSGEGCPLCAIFKRAKSQTYTNSKFIELANVKHNSQYDYSKTNINNKDEKGRVIVTCLKHGDFLITPTAHLSGRGCKFCGRERSGKKQMKTKEQCISDFINVWGNLYDYSKINYRGNEIKVNIICRKHGVFKCTPANHLKGRGCPICNSSRMENEIRHLLNENQIDFEYQKHFDWLGRQSLDFYLPKQNIAIECQGIQHFEPIEYFGGINKLYDTKERDIKKKNLCSEHNIIVIYYANYKYKFPYEVVEDKNNLLKYINNGNK